MQKKSAGYRILGVGRGIILIILLSCVTRTIARDPEHSTVQPGNEFISPLEVTVNGILGQAIAASEKGRLVALPSWKDGELIQIFSKESRDKSQKNDWYGEHGGKWLYSAALAVKRTHDEQLKSLLFRTADYLVSTQDDDGYLGTYSPERRITNIRATTHGTSWDVWNLSYMVLGLLEVNRYFPNDKYLQAAQKIGELFLRTFGEGKADITGYGTRKGMSATIIIEPAVELYKETRDRRYLDFAEMVVRKIEEKEGFRIVSEFLKKNDAENIGDGKAYQLIWNLAAIAKLYEETNNGDYLKAIENGWQNIATYHLTESGGPWGGIGKHYECFNRKGYWSPYGFVETCSTMAWMQLNRAMLRITGEAKYAQEIERSAYNALLGAQYPDGTNWCYHSFSNGSRHAAHFNDCCPSSGALALEELPQVVYSKKENGIACNVYTAGEASVILPYRNVVHISQKTDYPFDGKIRITISPEKEAGFSVFVRIPDWTSSAEIKINGEPVDPAKIISGEFFRIQKIWEENDKIEINFPTELKVYQKLENIHTPQGGKSISAIEWFYLARGPLVYACHGLINRQNRENVVPLPEKNKEGCFVPVTAPAESHGPAYELRLAGRDPLLFLPYYEAGGREPGSWRLTWIQHKID